MKRRIIIGIMPVLSVALILSLLNAMTPLASANDSAPEPATNVVQDEARPLQNNAEWTIGEMTFTSNYPTGFSFTLEASSSGGAIVGAEVEWVHRANRPGQPKQRRTEDGEIAADTSLITATWEATQSTAVPPWVGVEYHWNLRDEAGNEFETEPVQVEYEDTSKDWIRHESDDVVVFSVGLSDDIGANVVEAMDAQRQKYLDGWGGALPYRPRVILFGGMDDWLEWQIGHQDTSGLGVITVGLTSDLWGGTVQVLYGPEDELAWGTVLHEIEHLYQNEFLAGRIGWMPGWFTEGDATFYQMDEGTLSYAMDYVSFMVLSDTLPTLLQGDGPSISGDDALDGYYVGYTFFKWMDEKFGIAMHKQIMDLLAADVPFFEALAQATGMTTQELERGWRIWLGATPDAPTLVPTWTPPPGLASPTPFKFN